jgi:hypothetical protein
VLESVTLGEMIKFVIQVLVDLAAGTILDEKPTKNSQTTHPQHGTVTSYQPSFGARKIYPPLPISPAMIIVGRTLAFSPQLYLSAFRSPDDGRCGEQD